MLPDAYPMADKLVNPMAFAQRAMKPQGVTVHYTGDGSAKAAIAALNARDLGYHLIIDRDGKVYQTCYLTQSVNHAGKAVWNKLSPNRHHVAVAIVSWGLAVKKGDEFTAWTGLPLPTIEVKRRKGNVNDGDFFWHTATALQEAKLNQFLRFCVSRGIRPENICGHDEASLPKGRKVDPGGVLTKRMAEIRDGLKNQPLS